MDIKELEQIVEQLLALQRSTEANAEFYYRSFTSTPNLIAYTSERGRALGFWAAANLVQDHINRLKKTTPTV